MRYQKAVDALYETVFQPERWRDTATECATLVNGTTFFLQVANPLTRDVEVVAGHGLESLGLAAYETHYHKIDIWRDGLLRAAKDRIHLYPELVDQAEFEGSEIFGDWVKPVVGNEVFWGLGGCLRLPDGRISFLASHRSRRQGEMSEEERAVFQRLVPHVRRVLNLRRLVEEQSLRGKGLEAICDSASPAAVLVDSGGRLVYANKRATDIFKRNDGLKLRADWSIEARLKTETEMLRRQVATACQKELHLAAETAPLRITQSDVTKPLIVTVAPVPSDFFSLAFARAVIFIEDVWTVYSPSAEKIMLAFGLTPSEASLVASLSEGLALREAAAQIGIAYNTARAHLRNILAKAGVARQSELLLRVARLR